MWESKLKCIQKSGNYSCGKWTPLSRFVLSCCRRQRARSSRVLLPKDEILRHSELKGFEYRYLSTSAEPLETRGFWPMWYSPQKFLTDNFQLTTISFIRIKPKRKMKKQPTLLKIMKGVSPIIYWRFLKFNKLLLLL